MRKLIISCKPEDKVIIDLGAGNPAITDGLNARKRIKVDINCATKPDIVCDLNNGIPLAGNSVDICVASEILEHVYNSKTLCREIRRILRVNGKLILSCPNICSLKYRLAFVMGKIPAHAARADCFYNNGRPGHIRDYNFDEIECLLNTCGFRTAVKKGDGLSFKGLTLVPPYFLPLTFHDSIITMACRQSI